MKNLRIITLALLVFVLLMGLTVSAYAQDKIKVEKKEKVVEKAKEECKGDCDCETPCEKHAEVKGIESEHVCTEECEEDCALAKLPTGHPKVKEGAHAGHEHAEHATEVHGPHPGHECVSILYFRPVIGRCEQQCPF